MFAHASLQRAAPVPRFHAESIRISTHRRVRFHDITERVREIVRRSGVTDGMVNVQTRHTTTAIVVNENEPLLLDDLHDLLRRWAPRRARYRHDDTRIRTVNLTPDERPNGDAHARALLLGCSESLNVVDGVLELGRWQRIFLVELDGARDRTVSVAVFGLARERVGHRELLGTRVARAAGAA